MFWYFITGVSLYRLNLGLILNIKQKFQEKKASLKNRRPLSLLFGSALLREKIHNGSEGRVIRNYTSSRYFRVNYSRTILVSIVKISKPTHHPTFDYLGIAFFRPWKALFRFLEIIKRHGLQIGGAFQKGTI